MSAHFSDLLGKTLTKIEGTEGDDEMRFFVDDGRIYTLYHYQDCCESVSINDIVGDLSDLIGSPIIEADEVTSHENPSDVSMTCQDSFTWTFYKLATAKGFVTIRWYGESNGYYSESVDFRLED